MFIEDCVYVSSRLLKDLQEVLDEEESCHIFALGIMEMKPVHGRQRFSQSREMCTQQTQTEQLKETLLLPLKCVYAVDSLCCSHALLRSECERTNSTTRVRNYV